MPEQFKPYNLEQAQDEAAKMHDKIKSGEAKKYDEANDLVEQDKQKKEDDYKNKSEINSGQAENNKEKNENFEIANIIDVLRVKLTRENKNSYIIQYGKEKIEIIKGEESCFVMPGGESVSGKQELRLQLTLKQMYLDGGIFQDEKMPEEFREVIMFHEIREREYAGHGMDNAHQRAVNDEILYILKYFSPEDQKAYLEFAKEYREKAQKDQRFRLLEEKKEKKRKQKEEEKKKKEAEIKKKLEEEELAREKERQSRVEALKKIVEPELGLPKNLSPEEIKEIVGIDTWLGIEYLGRPTFLHCLSGLAKRKGVTSDWIESARFKVEERASMFKAAPNILNNNVYQLLKNGFCNDFNLFLDKIEADHSLELKNNQAITVDKEIAERWEAKFLVLKDFFDQYFKFRKQDFGK